MSEGLYSTSGAPSILVLTAGTFGEQVGAGLRARHGASVQPVEPGGTHPSWWPHADLVILATSQERVRLAGVVDRSSFAWGRRWFPIYSSPTVIYCGPVVVPGKTACYQCFLRRREQHRNPAVPAAADAVPEAAPAHPRHHVSIAVALAEQAIADAMAGPDDDAIGGTVRLFDQVGGGTSRADVVAVDRCPRCRPVPDDTREHELWGTLAAASTRRPQEATR